MRFNPITCPQCSERAKGILEQVTGCALLTFRDDGTAEYFGDTEIFWDEQKPVDRPGAGAVLLCPNGHDWDAEADWSDPGDQSPGQRYTGGLADADNATEHGEP